MIKRFTLLLVLISIFQLHGQIPTNGLVAFYELDANAIDASGNSNNGGIFGNNIIGIENRFGEEDKALSFDGFTNYVEAKDSTVLNITDDISISLWIKPITVSQTRWVTLVNKWESIPDVGGKGYYLGINPNGVTLRWNTGSINSDGDPVSPGEWINIVATYDADSMKVYRDNVLEIAIPAIDTILPTIVPFRLGLQSEDFAEAGYFHGAMDEVLIYDRALTSTEVGQIFSNNPTSTEDNEFENLIVYPNPFDDFINIKNLNTDLVYGEIVDMQGRIVRKVFDIKNSQQISARDLQKGFYILNLYSEKGLALSKKIIKS